MDDLKTSLEAIKKQQPYIRICERYYDGRHELNFATAKFRNAFGELFRAISLNLIKLVIDAPSDKLTVIDFSTEDGDAVSAKHAWEIWQRNRMDITADLVHREALKTGNAYVIVWPDAKGHAALYPQVSSNMFVAYDSEERGKIVYAAKVWETDEGYYRLNLYYADRIERYVSRNTSKGLLPEAAGFTALTEDPILENQYGIVPVFHFANHFDMRGRGQSEMFDAIPIQQALNKLLCDMLVASEFGAFPQRWATGIEVEVDSTGKAVTPFVAGTERLWTSESHETKFGDFTTTDLKQFVDIKESFKRDIAAVTSTPLQYFMVSRNEAAAESGESRRRSESRFITKCQQKQTVFGHVWSDCLAFALRLEGRLDVSLFTHWKDPGQLSEDELLQNLLIKKDLGVSRRQLLIEAGYGEAQIRDMAAETQTELEAAASVFNAGE